MHDLTLGLVLYLVMAAQTQLLRWLLEQCSMIRLVWVMALCTFARFERFVQMLSRRFHLVVMTLEAVLGAFRRQWLEGVFISLCGYMAFPAQGALSGRSVNMWFLGKLNVTGSGAGSAGVDGFDRWYLGGEGHPGGHQIHRYGNQRYCYGVQGMAIASISQIILLRACP
jgi:hypothetical protein